MMVLNAQLFLGILCSLSIKSYGAPMCGQVADITYYDKLSQFDKAAGNSTCSQLVVDRNLVQCGTQADSLPEFLSTVNNLIKNIRLTSRRALPKLLDDRLTNIQLDYTTRVKHHQRPTSCSGQGCCDDLPTCDLSNSQNGSPSTCVLVANPTSGDSLTTTGGNNVCCVPLSTICNSPSTSDGTASDTASGSNVVYCVPVSTICDSQPTSPSEGSQSNCAVLVPSTIDCLSCPQNPKCTTIS